MNIQAGMPTSSAINTGLANANSQKTPSSTAISDIELTTDSLVKKTPVIYKVLLVLAMMTLMGGSLTGVMTFANVGYSDTFFSDWLSSFLIAAVTVMPAGVIVMTLLTKLIQTLFPNVSDKIGNLVVGLSMAVVMESAMALTTTLNNVGFDNVLMFLTVWLESFLTALPMALILIVIISMTIKPRIERFLKS
ncbi:DUF2798 domain-containing protein [Shewanella donghaensis]|uniref:DUF2798 domain-containing protein n=1 Tax=Shewanella donghaensis TaxID=238836 RepID=UPI001D04B024|nr:DUF2798 domain-containing protein [Shewanella donghaensis]